MFDPVASKLRRHLRHIERLNRRVALGDVPGKVIAGSQDMETRTLRLDIGKSADGRVIKSPKISWQQPGAGTFKIHATPKDDEQMRLRSPSGTVGTGSLADWSTFDDDNAPPSTSDKEVVLEYGGDARISMSDAGIVLSIGETKLSLTAESIEALSEALRLKGDTAIEGESLTHNDLNVGSTHVHGGVERGMAKTDPPS